MEVCANCFQDSVKSNKSSLDKVFVRRREGARRSIIPRAPLAKGRQMVSKFYISTLLMNNVVKLRWNLRIVMQMCLKSHMLNFRHICVTVRKFHLNLTALFIIHYVSKKKELEN